MEKYLKEELHLECEGFDAKPPAGYTTQARIEDILNRAIFAFIVMTAEDRHEDGKLHARQNVIHEAGLFQGRLGFSHAVLLVESGCETPSNLHGLTHIPFPKDNIRAAFHEIRRTLVDREIVAGL